MDKNTLMLWQNNHYNDKKPPTLDAIVWEAAVYYRAKYGIVPNLCQLNTVHKGPDSLIVSVGDSVVEIKLEYVDFVRPIEFHIGRNDDIN